MDIYTATEQAYKNGYRAALKDLREILFTGPHEFDKIVDKMLRERGLTE